MPYGKDYFDWQKDIGAFGGVANRFLFSPFLDLNDTLIDFGCGGGYLLKNLECLKKVGIEVNPCAIAQAMEFGIKVYDDISAVPDDFATIVISNHALEHLGSPLEVLKHLKSKVKKKGRLVFVVPHEGPKGTWKSNDINQHLYTWNPMTLGNLFSAAGYKVTKVEIIRHAWYPSYARIYQVFGERVFHAVSKLTAIRKGIYQIRVVAVKEE
jgi:SAM-dependent methyltransferase